MRKVRYVLGLALVMAASLYLLPALQAADEPVPDSPEVTNLLSKAKSHAIQLRDDSEMMHGFAMSNLSWESHAQQITTIKGHINNLGKVLQQMSDEYEAASPWQQKAIDHVTPLAREMAANVEETIDHLGENQQRVHMPKFRDYLKANYDLSTNLSKLISDYVSYGKNKANFEKLGTTLAVPGH